MAAHNAVLDTRLTQFSAVDSFPRTAGLGAGRGAAMRRLRRGASGVGCEPKFVNDLRKLVQ